MRPPASTYSLCAYMDGNLLFCTKLAIWSRSYKDLIRARETLVETLRKELTNDERQFLVSLKAGQPKWYLVGIDGVEKFPAVQWKLTNVRKMSAKKQDELLTRLMRVTRIVSNRPNQFNLEKVAAYLRCQSLFNSMFPEFRKRESSPGNDQPEFPSTIHETKQRFSPVKLMFHSCLSPQACPEQCRRTSRLLIEH
jgi:hypothetical protein